MAEGGGLSNVGNFQFPEGSGVCRKKGMESPFDGSK
jgi:hypothetical protein